MDLTKETALTLLESTEPFPIDFDLAWQWIGYAKKPNAKDKLVRNFEEGVDYVVTQMRESVNYSGFSPQELAANARKEVIYLTVDCLKSLGVMAGTAKGKEIRKYFLECEKIAKASLKQLSYELYWYKRVKMFVVYKKAVSVG